MVLSAVERFGPGGHLGVWILVMRYFVLYGRVGVGVSVNLQRTMKIPEG